MKNNSQKWFLLPGMGHFQQVLNFEQPMVNNKVVTMIASATLRVIVSLLISFICIMTLYIESKAESGKPVKKTTIKDDLLDVHSRMSEDSEVVKHLKKGNGLIVDFEVSGAEGNWCGIREEGQTTLLGYVLCQHLEREVPLQKVWKSSGTRILSGQKSPRSEKINSSSDKNLRPYSDITAVLYMTTW